jgi:nitrogen regulatory protein P-II 1
MKKIEAIIKPFQLEAVKDALSELGLDGMTVTEVKGFGRLHGYTEIFQGIEYAVDFRPKIKVEIILEDEMTEQAADAVIVAVRTEIGDGKVFISAIDEVVRIRTAETGNRAA